MAIVDSIILGRAKGSIGNVTLSTVQGRVIAKQKATIVSNPNTEAQQEQRKKLSKAVLAWQAVGNYVKSGWTSLLPFCSQYQTYTSRNIYGFATKSFSEGKVTGEDLKDSLASYGKLGTLNYSANVDDTESITVTFDKAGLTNMAKVGDKIKLVASNTNSENFSYAEVEVDSSLLSAGSPQKTFSNLSLDDESNVILAIWVESADGKNSSTSKFVSA
ncbi:DUF6266 family protein [Riemerella anatipestifer]|uniref:DUF6266 family protein n=1 Tax=Riemerella anatipestifer TaxID=34085 RepID=UPI002856D683|nr:DUF6266 family protein [Riemerella anatipestifer]MDR7712472.1 DUF6266 family protein [Riemerella anatipestifer]MDR7724820.1 DUF6266 family protein [Riemerella anatipestifer]MDR7735298.1 DUF6266 family protein [Riemerella anatipestifer]MDR7772739.1 DUF6266 family protein [Riemerella anatipestifer]